MLYSGTDPESYITEYTLVYEDKTRAKTKAPHRGLNPSPPARVVAALPSFPVQITTLSRLESKQDEGKEKKTRVASDRKERESLLNL